LLLSAFEFAFLLLLLNQLALALGHALVKEVFEAEQLVQDLEVLVNLRLNRSAVVRDRSQSRLSIVLLFLDCLQFLGRDVGLFLDLGEKVKEALRVRLQHLLSAHKSLCPRGIVQRQVLDLLELSFVKLLSQKYLTFLFL
jgi:hypothetical protein